MSQYAGTQELSLETTACLANATVQWSGTGPGTRWHLQGRLLEVSHDRVCPESSLDHVKISIVSGLNGFPIIWKSDDLHFTFKTLKPLDSLQTVFFCLTSQNRLSSRRPPSSTLSRNIVHLPRAATLQVTLYSHQHLHRSRSRASGDNCSFSSTQANAASSTRMLTTALFATVKHLVATEMSPVIKPREQLWAVNHLWVFAELLQHRRVHCIPHNSGTHLTVSVRGQCPSLQGPRTVNVWPRDQGRNRQTLTREKTTAKDTAG